MNKFRLTIISVLTVSLLASHALAATSLPANDIWVTPANAAQGSAIVLNALVYNNTTQDATVTVTFTDSAGSPQATVIGTIKQLVTSESAKTLTQDWVMPKTATVVTGAITTAVNKRNQSIPSLVGTLGTITVGANSVTPVVTGISFPGSAQLSAWFGPFFAKIEAWRANEAVHFTNLRDQSKQQAGITKAPVIGTPVSIDGLPPITFDNPTLWFTVIYSTALASLFSNAIIFYIAIVLLILLLLRFIVNLVF